MGGKSYALRLKSSFSAAVKVHSYSPSVSVSVSLPSLPASPSVSLSSLLDSSEAGFLARFGLAPAKPPVFSAFIWPARDSVSPDVLAKLLCSDLNQTRRANTDLHQVH